MEETQNQLRQLYLNGNEINWFLFFFVKEKLLVILRDGRKLIGVLRSFDHYGTYSEDYFKLFSFYSKTNFTKTKPILCWRTQ